MTNARICLGLTQNKRSLFPLTHNYYRSGVGDLALVLACFGRRSLCSCLVVGYS